MKNTLKIVCLVMAAVMICGVMFSLVGCKKEPTDATPIPGSKPGDNTHRVDGTPAPTANHSTMQVEADWGIKTAEPLFTLLYQGKEYVFNASKLYSLGTTEAGALYTEASKVTEANYNGVNLKTVLAGAEIDVGALELQDIILYYADGSSESIIGLDNCVFFASVISPFRNHVAVEPNAGVFFVATGNQPTEVIKEFEGVVKIEIK